MSSRLHPAAASPNSDTEPLLMPAQDPEKGRSPASRRQSESANQDFLIIKVIHFKICEIFCKPFDNSWHVK